MTPENDAGASSVAATRAARPASAMPVNRQCPAFEVRTRHGLLSPSSASA